MLWFLLVFFMLGTDMEKLLNVKNVSWSSISASLHDQADELGHILTWEHLDDLQWSLNKTLLTQEKKTKSESEDSSEAILEVLLIFL